MLQLLKKDYLLIREIILFYFLFLSIVHVFNFSADTFVIFLYIYPIFQLFVMDSRYKLNQYIIGLPVSRKEVVYSRYLFCLLYTVSFWLTNILIATIFVQFDMKPMNWTTDAVVYCGLIVSLSMSVFLYFISLPNLLNVVLYFLLIMWGVILAAFGLFDWLVELSDYPWFVCLLLCLSLLIYYWSMRLSEGVFAKHDLA